ncbi:MAG TPA: hypothetical protein VHO70_12210 [Chitinispirillaceae bacterium]|nr:hypothetical protein [Chitinispirillaceae bacterium]
MKHIRNKSGTKLTSKRSSIDVKLSVKTPFLIILSVLLFHLFPCAEVLHLSGTVINDINQPVAGAEVHLYSRTAIRTVTDKNGVFELTGSTSNRSERHASKISNHFILKKDVLIAYLKPGSQATLTIYSVNGRLFYNESTIPDKTGITKMELPFSRLSVGIFILTLRQGSERMSSTCALSENEIRATTALSITPSYSISLSSSISPDFCDIIVVSSSGKQTVRHAVTAPVEDDINIKLMPSGVGYVTPGIPVYTDKGGIGDVTTYGSVSNPEYSQGGACNYGSTKIRYYAAINVNQLPGDKKGDWQDGQICGRCARVRVRAATGEERTTVVRIMDKCPDDNCGIDLGGAPAAIIMNSQAGRYSGEWEWVTCEDGDSVSDGPPSLYVKTGSNEWWSLVQTRNGPGSALQMRVKKAESTDWQVLKWATEAENFFRLPVELIQDTGDWEIEVDWSTGTKSSLKIAGKKLSLEDSVYNFE